MRIFELPFALWPGREPAIGILAARETRLGLGANVFLGNGQVPRGTLTGCVLTLDGQCDDTLVILVNGIPLKDDNLPYGSDPLEFDLFDLAATAGLTLNAGDLVQLFAKDVVGVDWATRGWTAVLSYDDGTEDTVSGGQTTIGASVDWPAVRLFSMGSFQLGTPASRQATSFQRIGSMSRHAKRGFLVENYAATAPVIDTEVCLVVTLIGPDNTLGEYTEFSAHAGDLLVLINDEVFSVAGAALLSPQTYRLSVFRARFGTSKSAHSTGDEVYLFEREDLFSFSHPIAQPGKTLALKLSRLGGGRNGDASESDAVGFTVAGWCPNLGNLAVEGQLSGAVVAASEGITITWSLPANLDIPSWTFQTRLQLIQGGLVMLERLAEGSSETILAADLGWLIPGPVTIQARLEAVAKGCRFHSDYIALTAEAL